MPIYIPCTENVSPFDYLTLPSSSLHLKSTAKIIELSLQLLKLLFSAMENLRSSRTDSCYLVQAFLSFITMLCNLVGLF